LASVKHVGALTTGYNLEFETFLGMPWAVYLSYAMWKEVDARVRTRKDAMSPLLHPPVEVGPVFMWPMS
jgi:hypothetical protein